MTKSILVVSSLVVQLWLSCKEHSVGTTSPSPGASVTMDVRSDRNNDSVWWGVWRHDSVMQNGESFRITPMYYYFLPDKRCFVITYLKDSISDFDGYKNRHNFFVRNDSVFMSNVLSTSSGDITTGDLLFTFDSISTIRTRVVFPNGNVGWMSQILVAKTGSNIFFEKE